MEADNVDILVMANEYAKKGDVVGSPQTRGPIVRPGHKVMAEGTPLDIPNEVVVPFVDNQTGPRFE